jgi:hypothetical protein
MAQGPIVLELFTSQGCSTCPAAERLLSRLGRQLGRRVVPLEFHVDYWNQGGWFDPLSDRDWTARQAAYDRALGKGMYTPQLVVNGTVHFPGGSEPRARAEIASRLEGPGAARISVAARKGEGGRPALMVAVTAEVTERVEAPKLEILVALFENHVVTGVESGENRGQTLESDFVVRRLQRALSLEAKVGTRGERTLAFKLRPEWKAQSLGVAAFLQDPASMKIHAAVTLPSLD